MSFSSIASMLSAAQESGQPLYAVIRDADCQENGYDAAASYRQIAALWTAMQQCADAYAIALGNLLGLVCDPVAGLVEVPCVKRNVIGAVNAVSAANMAVAGITSRIPVDEVIDAMGEIGDALPADLRETGLGGLAGTPTGRKIARKVTHADP